MGSPYRPFQGFNEAGPPPQSFQPNLRQHNLFPESLPHAYAGGSEQVFQEAGVPYVFTVPNPDHDISLEMFDQSSWTVFYMLIFTLRIGDI
jgi:hypothetical protein